MFFFFKQKTAYEMRISDWSSDVCSSDLIFNAAADDIVPWVTVGQCGFQLPKVKFAPNQKWISPWMGPGKAHSFEALPDRKVARIGEASILCKPFKAIHLVHIGKGLRQVDQDRKSTRMNSSHSCATRLTFSA